MYLNTDLTVIVVGELFDYEGNLKQKFVKHNLITSAGYDFLANCMCNVDRPSPLKYIAVGSGDNKPTFEDVELQNEVMRKLCDYSHSNGSTFLALGTTLEPGEATGALTEAGILNSLSGGVLFDRVTFPVVNKEPMDTYRISFTLTFKELEVI